MNLTDKTLGTAIAQTTAHLDNLVQTAIAKKIKPEPLPPGKYRVEGLATIRIIADVKKGDPGEYAAVLPAKAILGLLLDHSGVVGPKILAKILARATDALANGDKLGESLGASAASVALVETELAKLPKKPREGNTRVDGIVELIEFEPAAQPALAE